jgi:DNA-binding transcriptional regulator YiaG
MMDATIRIMSPRQVRAARVRLGQMWGLGRALTPDELARELGMGGREPGNKVQHWETGSIQPSGPVSRLLQALLAGFRPSLDGEQPELEAPLPEPRSAPRRRV